eukprot:1155839-Amphidinium_carterae.1
MLTIGEVRPTESLREAWFSTVLVLSDVCFFTAPFESVPLATLLDGASQCFKGRRKRTEGARDRNNDSKNAPQRPSM